MTDQSSLPTTSPFTRRRFLGVSGGALASALLMAACGSNTGREAATTAASGGTTGSGGSGSKPALAQWYHQYGETGTQQAAEGYAAAYPDATVSVQWTPGDYESKLSSALVAGNGPDVFEWGNGPSIDQIQGGQVAALDDLLGDAKSDFTSSLLQRMSYDGKLYGIPQVIDMQLLVYRPSLLQAAGVQPPQTFDDLVTAAGKLTSGGVKGLFVGNDGGGGVLTGPTLWSVGADYLTTDNKVGFDQPAVAEAFGRLHELFTSGSLLLGAPTDWSDPSAITQGLTAMQWTGLWTLPTLAKELGDDFAVTAWPKYSASVGAPSVPIGAYGSVVNAKGANVDAAKAYVKWLWVDNTADQLDWAQSYGFHIPARQSVAAQADKLKSGVAADAVALVQNSGHAQSPLLWTPASGTAMSDAVSRIIKDGADPTEQLGQVATTVQSELQRVAG